MKTASEQRAGKPAAPAEDQAPGEQSSKRTGAGSGSGKRRKKRSAALSGLLWTLRIVLVPVLLIAALIGGLYVGYVVLGKAPEGDVWEIETWMHMYDLIFSDS